MYTLLRALVGRRAVALQHFEIYLIGTNFVFRKLKFDIGTGSSRPRNFFSPPKLKMLPGALTITAPQKIWYMYIYF